MIDYQKRTDVLHGIVCQAGLDPVVRNMVFRQGVGILTTLGASHEDAVDFLIHVVGRSGKQAEFAQYEYRIQDALWGACDRLRLSGAMMERTQRWIDVLDPHLRNENVEPREWPLLDLGGGSGELAQHIREKYKYPVMIADVLDWRRHKEIPFVPVVDNHIDLPDGSFATALVVTVFHHTDDPAALVTEAFRLASQRVIFIESVAEDPMMFHYAAWIDWFYNHILHFNPDVAKKINVPCNFKSARGWENLVVKLTGLRPIVSQNLGIYQFLNPEQHHLFVYEKEP